MKAVLFCCIVTVCMLSSCHREEAVTTDSNALLSFSEDTLFFDTLFASSDPSYKGSISKKLKVLNRNSRAVMISAIELAGKSASPYEVIINGMKTSYLSNIELRGGDSLFIFANVKILQQQKDLPFLVEDSLLFYVNGNIQDVQLRAYGQNALFLSKKTLPCDTVWRNTIPFVVYDFARIAPGCTLTIEKGVNVYFHDNAFLKVEGTLIVKGEKDSVVTFSGDKRSGFFKDLPGQWQGLVFEESGRNSRMEYVLLKNATSGITLHPDPSDNDTLPDLKLNNVKILNMKQEGLRAEGRDVLAINCLFANSVSASFAGLGGGNYYFEFCTFANYSYDFFREASSVELSNAAFLDNGTLSGPLHSGFTNCIIWGDQQEELTLSDDGVHPFQLHASHNLIRTKSAGLNSNSNLINIDPAFVRPSARDFHLSTGSPAIGVAAASPVSIDLEGKARDTFPDTGAYEK